MASAVRKTAPLNNDNGGQTHSRVVLGQCLLTRAIHAGRSAKVKVQKEVPTGNSPMMNDTVSPSRSVKHECHFAMLLRVTALLASLALVISGAAPAQERACNNEAMLQKMHASVAAGECSAGNPTVLSTAFGGDFANQSIHSCVTCRYPTDTAAVNTLWCSCAGDEHIGNQANEGQVCSCALVGKPIDPGSGLMYHDEPDIYVPSGLLPLTFERRYTFKSERHAFYHGGLMDDMYRGRPITLVAVQHE